MDCYFHNAVPSVAACNDCAKTICATCRDEQGICPGCRLERRINSASGGRQGIPGGVGPSNPPPSGAAPPPQPPPTYGTVTAMPQNALATVSPETRALLGLGYPLWPLAIIALLDPKKSPPVRRQAVQALALNAGMFALFTLLTLISQFWVVISWPAWVILPFIFPVWLVATVVYGFKAWRGEDVRVPLVSDWLDERERRREHIAA